MKGLPTALGFVFSILLMSMLLVGKSSLWAQPEVAAEVPAVLASELFLAETTILETITIRGVHRIKPKKVRSALRLKTGAHLEQTRLRAAFRRLYQSELFKELQFFLAAGSTANLVELIVVVEEYPVIGKIDFVGNRQFPKTTLRSELDIAKRNSYRANEVLKAREALLKKYRDASFNNVNITYSITTAPDSGKIFITFFIEEGSKLRVKDIRFTNNTAIKANKLRSVMETKKLGWARKAKFSAAVFESDKQKIIYAFQSEGYVTASITGSNFSYAWKKPKRKRVQHMFIGMTLNEGELYYFGTTALRGNTIFSTERIRARFGRKEGEHFDQSQHDADINALYQIYQEQGYIFSRVTPIATTNADRSIDYVFDVYEGRKAHIENIFIEGLIKTKERVVKREFSIEAGEIFNVTELRASLTRLNRLGYFSEISPDYHPGSAEGLMNIVVLLKEQQTGVVSGGISYSTLYGFSLIFNLEEKNLAGRGQTLKLGISYGVLVKELKISFIEPWIGGVPISLGGSVTLAKYYRNFYTNQTVTNEETGEQLYIEYPGNGATDLVQNTRSAVRYTEDLVTFSIFSGQTLKNWFNVSEGLSINYSHEYLQDYTVFPETYKQTEVYELNKEFFDPAPPDEENFYYILSASFTRDRRDSLLNPTRGAYAKLGTFFYFGDYQLSKWHLDAQAVFSPVSIRRTRIGGSSWHLTFSYKMRLHTVANSLLGDFNYPDRLLYRFYSTELRGWNYDSIYEFRTARFGSNSLYTELPYGKALIEHEFEVRIGLPVDITQFIFFWEFGNLNLEPLGTDSAGAGFLFDFENFMYDLGFGLRINLSVFPIRLYWAWRYYYDTETERFRVYRPGGRFLGIEGTVVPEFVLDFQAAF